jgi:hypothetical protein
VDAVEVDSASRSPQLAKAACMSLAEPRRIRNSMVSNPDSSAAPFNLFAVEDIDDVVARLRAPGAELVGELV